MTFGGGGGVTASTNKPIIYITAAACCRNCTDNEQLSSVRMLAMSLNYTIIAKAFTD